jgi:hypothetical protein
MARALLILHALFAFAALLSATHLAVHAVLAALGRTQTRALLRFGWIAPATLLLQGVLGLAIYPAYRVTVRAPDFDRNAPFVAALFDLKEHLAALSLPLIIGAALAGRAAALERGRWPTAALSCAGAAFLWAACVLGLYVTARHPLGSP